MSENQKCDTSTKAGFFKCLMRPPNCSLLRMIVIGTVGGIIIWGGLNTGMEWTNRTEFCISCHEMTIPYEELKKTAHFKNRTGTTLTCADCHVASSKNPVDYARKLTRKVVAARDVYGHLMGTIDTPEKYEAMRLTMAQREWARMKEADSKECRNCHDFTTMDKEKQKDRSVVKHEGAIEDGKTCIDCHKGIAHKPVHHLLVQDNKEQPELAKEAAKPATELATSEVKKDDTPAAAAPVLVTAAVPSGAAPAPVAAAAAAAPAAPSATGGAGIDWSKVAPRKMTTFYPGQASFEWVMNKDDHSSAVDIVEKKRPCAKCHEGDASEIGDKMVAGKPVGVSKSILEPQPQADKAGSIPVIFKAAHDGNKIYFRFEWVPPKIAATKLDPKNELKLTMMFDGGGTVNMANINGCWSTCHDDLRTMKDAKDDKKTKYIKDANVAGGKFMDLIQYRSGDKKGYDGYVAESRVMDGGKSLIKAEGKKEGNKWVVTFERNLAGGGKGDHAITANKVYNFGFAIHEGFTNARIHYVSLGYQFGLDKDQKDVKNYINITKQ